MKLPDSLIIPDVTYMEAAPGVSIDTAIHDALAYGGRVVLNFNDTLIRIGGEFTDFAAIYRGYVNARR